jgi:hypothetical protein
VELVAADGQGASSGMRAQDRRSQGLAAAVDLSVRERGSISAKAFLTSEDVRRGGRMTRQKCAVGRRAYSGSARAVREAYMNLLISSSLPSFYSPVCAASSRQRIS